MIKQTRWRPDVCSCVLLYDYDTENNNQIVNHITESLCERHARVREPREHFQMVKVDNLVKNFSLNCILENYPENRQVSRDGNLSFVTKPTWNFDESGIMNVTLADIDTNTKGLVKTALTDLATQRQFVVTTDLHPDDHKDMIADGIANVVLR